jgi:hypothetical protein
MKIKTNVKAGANCWDALNTVEKNFNDFVGCCRSDPNCLG